MIGFNPSGLRVGLWLAILTGWGSRLGVAEAQTYTQEITLRPGWNSIHLEVQPADNRAESVFSGLPVESVWTRSERLSPADFIQNQNEVDWNEAGWLVFLPPENGDAFLTSLHAVFANRPYLIKVRGSQSVVWRVAGRPSLRHPAWVADAFNLRGFPVDPDRPPRFIDFFRGSAAHFDAATGQLTEIYRLAPSGQWVGVGSTELMKAGEALWVSARGASRFQAPLEVDVDEGDGLDFDALLEDLPLRVRNGGGSTRMVAIQSLGTAGAQALARQEVNRSSGLITWTALGTGTSLSVSAGDSAVVRIAPRRAVLAGNELAEVLSVTDGMGVRHLVPVVARRRGVVDPIARHPHVGLWIGSVRVTAVAEVHGADPSTPTPTASPFSIRVLMHVDPGGRVHLLKEVVQLWENGTYRTGADGVRVPDQPGRFVWVTNPDLFGRFQGATLRDGVPVGRRLSTAGIDFDGGTNRVLALAGEFQVGGRLSGSIVLAPPFPTHPYRHKFHPDHDNLDERFASFRAEAFEVGRDLEFEFTAADPTGFSSAGYGHEVMGGLYRETLTGLTSRPIQVRGDFRLHRVADTPDLNPAPRTN